MADLATDLLRTVVRAFYPVECVLIVDALLAYSTLPDSDLAQVVHMQTKTARRFCGRLKEDGLLAVQTRAERRTDGSGSFYPSTNGQPGKERLTQKEWFYLNYHTAIDSIKYRMYKLNKHVESQGAPTTEKKDLVCPQCKGQYTDLEVMDRIDMMTGMIPCPRCGFELDRVEGDERTNENESMKRLNSQLEKILDLMQRIDAATVPENDFSAAVAKHRPIHRTAANPGKKTEVVDNVNLNLKSTRGLDIKPEKITVQLQNDEDVKREAEAAEAQEKRDREARQNALPEWISKSTVSGDITSVGAKEAKARAEREANLVTNLEEDGDKKGGNDDQNQVMEAYWEELAREQAREAAKAREEEEEDEEDDEEEDEFEDVDGIGTDSGTPAHGSATNGKAPPSTGVSTPALESSNATDDERETKRVRIADGPRSDGAEASKMAEGTPAASDTDDDDDDLQFENV